MNGPSHEKLVKLALDCIARDRRAGAFDWAETGRRVLETCMYPDLHAIELLTGGIGPWRIYFPRKLPKFNFEIAGRSGRAFLPKIHFYASEVVKRLRRGDVAEAGRFAGVFSHYVGDFAEPAHYYELDIGMLLPPPPDMRNCNYHPMLEGIESTLKRIRGRPQLLGQSLGEFEFRLEGRFCALHARSVASVAPIVQAIYRRRNDRASRVFDGVMAESAQLLADFLYTAQAIGARRFGPADVTWLRVCDLTEIEPHEWDVEFNFGNRPLVDAITVEPYGRARPLRLRLDSGGIQPVKGVCPVPHALPLEGSSLSSHLEYRLPKNVYARFDAVVGLQADVDRQAACRFEILLDGTQAYRGKWVRPQDAAQRVSVELHGGRRLRLRVETDGSTDKLAFPIWGEPTLRRAGERD